MILTMIGCCLIGGGLKGFVDSARHKKKMRRLGVIEHTPLRS